MKKELLILTTALLLPALLLAGNDNKRGQAGATELLINPFARNTGWAGANTAGVRGLESMYMNIAGLAYVDRTDLLLSTTNYLSGAGITISNLAFGTRVGSGTGVLGASVTAFSMGDFLETTYFVPEGTGNTFTPNLFNLSVSYAQRFSSHITGGVLVRIVNQSIPNASATGACIDAGVQYQTGPQNEFKLGVSLRNIGPKLRYEGDGLRYRGFPDGNRTDFSISFSQLSQPFDMPALLNIGTSYDFNLAGDHRLTPAMNFVSNSFTRDQYMVGLEYAFQEMFYLRAGWNHMGDILSQAERTDAHTGPSFGGSVELPFAEVIDGNGSIASEGGIRARRSAQRRVSLDYSYRSTNPFNGTHTLGVTLHL